MTGDSPAPKRVPRWRRRLVAWGFALCGSLACYWLIGEALERIYLEGRYQTNQEFYALMRGPATLIENELRIVTPDRWPEVLDRLQRNFDYELHVKNLKDVHFLPGDRLRVMRGEIARGDEGDVDNVHLRIAKTDQVIAMGPIWVVPIKHDYGNFVSVRLFGLVTILVLLIFPIMAIWIWLAPARRDLTAIHTKIISLVRGEPSTPLFAAESSVTRPVIEGLNQLANHWRSLVDSQRELSRAVSHELRTPVARMRFGLALLSDEVKDENTRVLHSLERSLTDLEDLVECSLTYARYTQARPALLLEERPLLEWVQAELHNWLAEPQRINLTVSCLENPTGTALFDATHMKFALRNLVNNAMRFAASKVEVKVAVSAAGAYIHVEDDGPGVSDADSERIFEPFVRGRQPMNGSQEGHGLGLAIACRIVDWHNGRISLSRSPAQGARFSLHWPNDRRAMKA